MKTTIEFPAEQLMALRNELKKHNGSINEISKRTNISIALISLVLSGKRKINNENASIIIEAKAILKEIKEKSEAFVSLMQD